METCDYTKIPITQAFSNNSFDNSSITSIFGLPLIDQGVAISPHRVCWQPELLTCLYPATIPQDDEADAIFLPKAPLLGLVLILLVVWVLLKICQDRRTALATETLPHVVHRLHRGNASGDGRTEKGSPTNCSGLFSRVTSFTLIDERLESGTYVSSSALGKPNAPGKWLKLVEVAIVPLRGGFQKLMKVLNLFLDILHSAKESLNGCQRALTRLLVRLFCDQRTSQKEAILPEGEGGEEAKVEILVNEKIQSSHLIYLNEKQLLHEDDAGPIDGEGVKQLCKRCRHKQREKKFNQKVEHFKSMDNALYCSGCRMFHPLIFFSARQKEIRRENRRKCIAWEGCLRLCSHKSLKYDQVLKAAGILATADIEWELKPTLADCDHDYRRIAEREPGTRGGKRKRKPCLSPKAILQRTGEDQLELVINWYELKRVDALTTEEPKKVNGRSWFEEAREGLAGGDQKSQAETDATLDSGLNEIFPDSQARPTTVVAEKTDQRKCESQGRSKKKANHKSDKERNSPDLQLSCCGTKVIRLGSVKDIGNKYSAEETIHPGWYEAIDPESYVLHEDKETESLFWCKNNNCANHYKDSRDMRVFWKEIEQHV